MGNSSLHPRLKAPNTRTNPRSKRKAYQRCQTVSQKYKGSYYWYICQFLDVREPGELKYRCNGSNRKTHPETWEKYSCYVSKIANTHFPANDVIAIGNTASSHCLPENLGKTCRQHITCLNASLRY